MDYPSIDRSIDLGFDLMDIYCTNMHKGTIWIKQQKGPIPSPRNEKCYFKECTVLDYTVHENEKNKNKKQKQKQKQKQKNNSSNRKEEKIYMMVISHCFNT